jgi:hypothetical protein
MFTFEEDIDQELMKRRLSHKGKRVYVKSLTPTYALVSYEKEGRSKLFKLNVDDLAQV